MEFAIMIPLGFTGSRSHHLNSQALRCATHSCGKECRSGIDRCNSPARHLNMQVQSQCAKTLGVRWALDPDLASFWLRLWRYLEISREAQNAPVEDEVSGVFLPWICSLHLQQSQDEPFIIWPESSASKRPIHDGEPGSAPV